MLRLKISESPEMNDPVQQEALVGPAGLMVGRSHENDFILPDESKLVSRFHFKIFFRDGKYILLDTSANGCYVNDCVVGEGNTVPLTEGDRIWAGCYQLTLERYEVRQELPSIGTTPRFVKPKSGEDPGDLGDVIYTRENVDSVEANQEAAASIIDPDDPEIQEQSEALHWEKELHQILSAVTNQEDNSEAEEILSSIKKVFAKELCRRLGGLISNHKDEMMLEDLLRVYDEMAAMLLCSVPWLKMAVDSRANFKYESHIARTEVRAQDNNPLKFCDTAEDALSRMLLNDRKGFLRGRRAIEEVLQDLVRHQLALLESLHLALTETFTLFSPEALKSACSLEGAGGLFTFKGKGYMWERYCGLYDKYADSNFDILERFFLESLAKHYVVSDRKMA